MESIPKIESISPLITLAALAANNPLVFKSPTPSRRETRYPDLDCSGEGGGGGMGRRRRRRDKGLVRQS
eukprot:CAMPEP_0175075840 /NCGR_PEP_ID=MMETSP0052_2-20121109/22311_1 /TAXON_ID=51329 ORGANISM="Polytomella parva, Strain SAG 63-3" /NCGR_SAMPLE_ID=MMETSP0052_2 /ASSEMBLY_ACC=CAM_ASM_000194 /LENGTH=68 /DNA_ID=CAMNT_0016344745 /DNA_START=52 /DNA_END=254 /DNA_ORIENTATION=-